MDATNGVMTDEPEAEGPDECPPERTAGIDYYRAILTAVRGRHAAVRLVRDIHEQDVSAGEVRKEWRFQGYEGYATPRLRAGTRGGRLIWETSGAAAPDIAPLLLAHGGRTTRLDVQTTLRFSRARPWAGMRSLGLSPSSPLHRPQSRRLLGLWSDSRGAFCGTVGNRTGANYWRIYDKGAEQRDDAPGHKWRIELEAKGRLALGITKEICETPRDPSWYYQRVRSSWVQEGFSWPVRERSALLPPVRRPPPREPCAGRAALWLKSSVSPVIRRLRNVFTTAELLDLLSLGEAAQPVRHRDRYGRVIPVPNDGGPDVANLLQVAYQGAMGSHPADDDR